MPEFKPITTQEEFDNAIKDRLERERRTAVAPFADYEQIKNDLALLRKQSGEKDTTIAQLQKDLQSTKTDLAKTRIALEKGLPQELASRLTGETEDDLRKDADTLAQLFSDKKGGAEPSRSHEPAKAGAAGTGRTDGKINSEDFAEVLGNLNLGGNSNA